MILFCKLEGGTTNICFLQRNVLAHFGVFSVGEVMKSFKQTEQGTHELW